MKNNQLLPFERNRYYAGKMLTSSDFGAEQDYFNNKRRFMNQLMYGSGIVCGCGVVSLDDLSVLVESGAAVDDYGREIVIDSSVVKKLSAIKGFEDLTSNHILLCLRYKEQEVHSVYSVNHQETGKEYEFNRINEGYEIFLTDAPEAAINSLVEDEFLLKNCIYTDDNYRIEFIMPALVCKGHFAKLEVAVSKRSDTDLPVTFSGMIQMPVFTSLQSEHELDISWENVNPQPYETITREFWVRVPEAGVESTEIIMKKDTVKVIFDQQEFFINDLAPVKISISNCVPEDLVTEEIGKPSLEMRNLGNKKDYLCLADLKLVRTDEAYFIESIREQGIKQYIAAPARHFERINYLSYFAAEKSQSLPLQKEQETANERQLKSRKPIMATGVLEIPLGNEAKKGDIRYSGEIMHGLGRGNVYVTIGYESYTQDPAPGANIRSTVYGDPDLFRDGSGNAPIAETAVKVLNDKGSFIAAACLLNDIAEPVLSYRWIAIKFQTDEEKGILENYNDKGIMAVTPTVVLKPKENYFFEVLFDNMESCSIAYELTETGSGEITMEGIYTAPAREGVYEIRIYCTDMPVISTYAYAIVKGKKAED